MIFVRDAQNSTPDSGGYLRSLQISELVLSAEHRIVDIVPRVVKPVTWLDRRRRGRQMRALKRLPDTGQSADRFRLKKTSMHYHQTRCLLDDLSDVRAFLWERTQRHGGVAAARHRGIPTVALCHNLESLVPSEDLMYSIGGLHERFRAECDQLARADARVVISERDQWLLRLFGIDSTVLPYHPPRERLLELEQIRRARALRRTPQRRLMIMGSAHYPPTYEGMRYLIETITRSGLLCGDMAVDVLGFGSHRLQPICQSPGIDFHGAVDKLHLYELMKDTAAAVVYQHSGSGALTRIPEYLAAGIPVLANPTAARNYEHLPGVALFRDDEELIERVRALDAGQNIEAAPQPVRAEQRFMDLIESIEPGSH